MGTYEETDLLLLWKACYSNNVDDSKQLIGQVNFRQRDRVTFIYFLFFFKKGEENGRIELRGENTKRSKRNWVWEEGLGVLKYYCN
jgi:hypothetical protein